MDILHLILNNGYNPYLIHGYGGLGYIPPEIKGGALEVKLVQYDPENKRNDIKLPDEGGEIEYYPLVPTQPTSFLWNTVLNEEATDDDKALIFGTIRDKKEKNLQLYNNEFNKYLKKLPEETRNKVSTYNEGVRDLAYKYSDLFKKYFPKNPPKPKQEIIQQDEKLVNQLKKMEVSEMKMYSEIQRMIKDINDSLAKPIEGLSETLSNKLIKVNDGINKLPKFDKFIKVFNPLKLAQPIKRSETRVTLKNPVEASNELKTLFNNNLATKTYGLNNRLQQYTSEATNTNKYNLVKAYKDAIKYGLDLIVKNPTINTEEITNSITNYVNKLNDLVVKGGKYKIENNDLVQIKTSKISYEFDRNMEPKEAEKLVEDYWKDNSKTVLKESPDYGKNNNKYIREINESKEDVLNNKLPEEIVIKALKFREDFPNKNRGYAYMDTIKVGDKLIFKGLNKFKEREYNKAGKPAEFSICGVGNPLAKGLYKVENPNMQVSDFIVEDVFKKFGKDTKIGQQFCIDNVDIVNQIFSEMKDYKSINYIRCHKLNAQLKEIYYNILTKELKELILKYSLEEDEDEKELLKQDIKAYKNTLIDKNEFDKDFYRNRKYIGVGITMNKFTKIEIPEDYDFDESPSTQEQLEKVKSNQGQKFNPIMSNRHITKVVRVRTGKNDTEADFFDKNFNKEVIKQPMTYYITTNFSKVLGTYNYSKDDLVENDFILGTYKTAYAEDDRNGTHYNAVLIPIEKFDLSYL